MFPPFLIPAFAIGYLYRELSIGYFNTCRDLRRMESNSRSPIYNEFGELLEGIVTVRASSAEIRFLDIMLERIDFTTKVRSLDSSCLPPLTNAPSRCGMHTGWLTDGCS
jgi:hypothetical protein